MPGLEREAHVFRVHAAARGCHRTDARWKLRGPPVTTARRRNGERGAVENAEVSWRKVASKSGRERTAVREDVDDTMFGAQGFWTSSLDQVSSEDLSCPLSLKLVLNLWYVLSCNT